MVKEMIVTGERAGKIEENLLKSADLLRNSIRHKLLLLTPLIGLFAFLYAQLSLMLVKELIITVQSLL